MTGRLAWALGVAACAPAPPAAFELEVSAPIVVSQSGEDAHHATGAWTPDGRFAVVWTTGLLEAAPRLWARWADTSVLDDTAASTPTWPLLPDQAAAKGDIQVDAQGRWVVGCQTPADGVWLVRFDPERVQSEVVQVAPVEQARTNSSVDVALYDGMQPRLVWYDAEGDRGYVRGAALDAELSPTAGLPEVLAQGRHLGAAAPDVAASPHGVVAAWTTLPDTATPVLQAAAFGPGGEPRGVWRSAVADPAWSPRRPTVEVDAVDRGVISYRLNEGYASQGIRVAVWGPGGVPLSGPVAPVSRRADRPSAALVGDDRVFVAYERTVADGPRAIDAVVLTFPGLIRIAGPTRISTLPAGGGDAERPHVSAHPTSHGEVEVAVVYEQAVGRARWIAVQRLTL